MSAAAKEKVHTILGPPSALHFSRLLRASRLSKPTTVFVTLRTVPLVSAGSLPPFDNPLSLEDATLASHGTSPAAEDYLLLLRLPLSSTA